jgi:hypothetical protein
MRYADMMANLKQDIAWPDEPAHYDAVLLLEPQVYAGFGWLDISDKAQTPFRIDGNTILDFIYEEKSLPREFFPASFSVKGYKHKASREFQDNKRWPPSTPQVMVDFYGVKKGQFVVSSAFRDVLETAGVKGIDFVEVRVDTPPHMVREHSYYFMNVLAQAQMIDWSRISADYLAQTNMRPISLNSETVKAVPFKPHGPGDPLIWHEISLNSTHRSFYGNIYVRGILWNKLIKEFSYQFRHNNQLSLEA